MPSYRERILRSLFVCLTLFVAPPCLLDAIQPSRSTTQNTPRGDSSIHGRLTTTQGQPLQRARVMLQSGHGSASWQSLTDDRGDFRFDRIPAGSYLLSMSHPRYFASFDDAQFTPQPGRLIRVGPQASVKADIVAVRGGAITGTVYDRFGEPIPDVSVRAYRYVVRGGQRVLAPVEGRSYPSNDLGQYRIANLPSGKYMAVTHYRADASPESSNDGKRIAFAETWYPGLRSVAGAQVLRVTAGQDLAGINFQLHPTTFVQVAGTVSTTAGRPAAGAEVLVRSANEAAATAVSPMGARVSESGGFVVPNVQPGDYVLSARYSPAPVSERQAFSEVEYGHTQFSVGEHSIHGLAIQLRPGTRLSGRVQTDTALVARLTAQLMADGPGFRTQRVAINEGGAFQTTAGPGRYRLSITGLPEGWVVQSVLIGTNDITTAPFTIQTSAPLAVSVQLSSQGGTISGRVSQMGFDACANCTVVVMPEDITARSPATDSVKVVQTDEGGSFTVKALRAGKYLAIAAPYSDAEVLYDEDFWRFVERYGQRVTLVGGEWKQIALTLSEAGR